MLPAMYITREATHGGPLEQSYSAASGKSPLRGGISEPPYREAGELETPRATCGGCLSDTGQKAVTWAYVGEGKGAFRPTSYNYVGHGRGSYEQEVVVTPGKLNMRKVYLALTVLMLVLVAAAAVISLLAAGGKPSRLFRAERPRSVRPLVARRPLVSYNCDAGFENWSAVWPDEKKDWCCANHGRGCKPASSDASSSGCDTHCIYLGKTATCRRRIQYGADHRFLHQPNACKQAHAAVKGYCPVCGACDLVVAGCRAAPAGAM